METVFIADDELSIREGLKCIINWEEAGFTLCGEASNGKDALDRILAMQPSLVMLDVKMPKIHGTEVIRLAREAGYQGKCIILSGYSDFKYAQEAIKNGVSLYLTKPLDEDELYAAVREIKELLSAEKQQYRHLSSYKAKAKSIVLRELLTDTLDTPLTIEDIEHFHLQADSYQVVICEDFHKHSASAPYTFADLLNVINRENNIYEHLEINSKDIVLLKGSHGLRKLDDFLEHYQKRPFQDGSPMESMFLTYGRPVINTQDIHLSYEDAFALLERRFFCMPYQHTLGYEALSPNSMDAPNCPPLCEIVTLSEETLIRFSGLLTDYIQSYNRQMIEDTLHELEKNMNLIDSDKAEIKLFLTDLYLQVKENINRIYASAEIPFLTNSAVIEHISAQNYLNEILRFLSEQCGMMINAIGNPNRDAVLYDVLYYIDHNFRNNIKLEAIAPLFGYNSAYLGKIFNKTVGESFNSYVDHKRIECAKELLLEDRLKVYEIAEQVGYRNVDYFHKKFRKYVGQSPAEFRKAANLLSITDPVP